MATQISEIFGRIDDNGNVALFYKEGGAVTIFESEMPMAWPVDSDVSAYYEHPNGIVLEKQDAKKLGIEIEGE